MLTYSVRQSPTKMMNQFGSVADVNLPIIEIYSIRLEFVLEVP